MSKNIQIKEGNSPKVFNGVRKIRINDYPSGSSTWVPEDETVLGTKTINANGEYIASEEVDSETHENKGWYGYSKVTVNMSSRLGTKTIKEDGTYKASEEVDEETHQNKGWYGYSQVSVHGIGKGTYTAKEGDRINGQDLIPGEDYGIGKSEPWGDDDGEGEGGGEDTLTLYPYKIRVTQKPTKYEYNDGEDIDFTGIVVKAYKKDNSLWTDATHPNGVLSLSELTFAPTKADISETSRVDYTDEDGIRATKWKIVQNKIIDMGKETTKWCFPKPIWIYQYGSYSPTPAYLVFDGGCEVLVTVYNSELYIHSISGTTYQTFGYWASYGQDNQYWVSAGTSGRMSTTKFKKALAPNPEVVTSEVPFLIPESTKDPTSLDNIGSLIEVGGKQIITVTYERADGKKLKDTFEIDVSANDHDNPDYETGGGGHDF